MTDVKKTKRSNSTKLLGMLGKQDRRISREESRTSREDEDENQDSETPDVLPILRGSAKKKEQSLNNGTAKMISTEGMMKYEDMLNMLKCGECSELCTPPLVQCRKGHIYCSNCKQNKKLVQCKKCKQTFVDAPNLALDQLVRFIAIPCKYGSRGCTEFVFLDSRLQHETLCRFRPISCQFEHHGCTAIFSVKDMCWHHKMCKFAHFPHPNVLPSMPTRKKTKSRDGDPDTSIGEDTSSSCTNGSLEQSLKPREENSNPSVEVQTEIKLFPGVLSKN